MEKKNPPFDEMIRTRVVLHVPGMDTVEARRNVVYRAAGYAVLDLQEPPRGVDDGLGPEQRRDFSAVLGLGEDARSAPPLLVARAGLDSPWLNDGIDRFVRAALSGGATLDLLSHPDGRHAFDILDDDVRSRQIIRCTLAFLRDHLGP